MILILQGLDALKSLIWFSCCNNLIDRLPLSFARLPSIQMADFSNNKIELVPEHLASVSSLITLSIVGNKVNSQMPAFPGAEEQNVLKMASLHQMACLTSLNLECNKLTHVPMGLSVLSNLQYLRLGRNQIESHGKGGTSHPALEAADAMIQLKHLAPNLLFLELNQNRIDWIPKDLCQLSRLTHLDLSMNQVSSIPDEVSSLVALRTFKIDRNPLLSIPSSIASMSWLREFSSKDSVLGRVGGVVDAVPGGTVGRWRRQHGPIDGKIFQQLGKYLQLDPIVLANYEKARNYVEFDSHAGASGAVTQSISPLKSAGPKSGSPGTPGSRHGSRHGSRRGARSALATTHGWDEFIDAESTAAQHARGRQELIEAKARYIQRKNDKFANYGQKVAKSPGAFSMTILSPPTSPLKVLSTARGISGFASIATGILEKTEGSMSPASPTMRTGTFQSTRPHVRTYLFEHQLENSQFELEDGRKGKKEECWQPAVGKRNGTGRTSRGASRGGVGRAASAASAQSDNSDVSNDSNPAVVAHKMREKEIVRFNAQMGIVKDVEAQKAFEYYRNTATTPYLQIERLQGL